jgi:radical SAM-linked protein
MKFIGHLDIMRFFQKVMRRADIPLAFTGGFSPHMIMSFANPLGVGVTSDAEYFDIELKEPISSEKAVAQMNKAMVEGMEIVSFVQIPDDKKSSGMTIVAAADYLAYPKETTFTSDMNDMAEKFMLQDQIVVLKKTKRSEKEVDIKPMIYDFHYEERGMFLKLATGSEQNLKPELVMETFLKFAGIEPETYPMHYHRVEVYAKGEGGFVSLEALGKTIYE